MLFAAFWSAVNRGLRPRKVMYFLAAKSTKNSPADACAYFVPANVRNGRLFAGLQANRPRFLPLLAGPSFHGSGIGPESFAAKRGGEEAQQQDRKRSILPSPLKAVLNRRIIAWSGIRITDSPRVRTARRQAIRKKNLALRPACTIFGSALYRRRLGKLQTSLHLRPACTIFGSALYRRRLGKLQTSLHLRPACTIFVFIL